MRPPSQLHKLLPHAQNLGKMAFFLLCALVVPGRGNTVLSHVRCARCSAGCLRKPIARSPSTFTLFWGRVPLK